MIPNICKAHFRFPTVALMIAASLICSTPAKAMRFLPTDALGPYTLIRESLHASQYVSYARMGNRQQDATMPGKPNNTERDPSGEWGKGDHERSGDQGKGGKGNGQGNGGGDKGNDQGNGGGDKGNGQGNGGGDKGNDQGNGGGDQGGEQPPQHSQQPANQQTTSGADPAQPEVPPAPAPPPTALPQQSGSASNAHNQDQSKASKPASSRPDANKPEPRKTEQSKPTSKKPGENGKRDKSQSSASSEPAATAKARVGKSPGAKLQPTSRSTQPAAQPTATTGPTAASEPNNNPQVQTSPSGVRARSHAPSTISDPNKSTSLGNEIHGSEAETSGGQSRTTQLAVHVTMCARVNGPEPCAGTDDSLAGFQLDYKIYSNEPTGWRRVQTLTVTLGDNNNAGRGSLPPSQGRAVTDKLPTGSYVVCEEPLAYKLNASDVTLVAVPQPSSDDLAGHQRQLGYNCIAVDVVLDMVTLSFLNVSATSTPTPAPSVTPVPTSAMAVPQATDQPLKPFIPAPSPTARVHPGPAILQVPPTAAPVLTQARPQPVVAGASDESEEQTITDQGQAAIMSIAGISDPNVFILMVCGWMLVALGIRMRMLRSRGIEPK